MAFTARQYDVVLVHPPAQKVREPFYDTPDFPHIGLAYIGEYLHRHGQITPAIIDGKLGRLTPDETVDQVVALRPKVVGFTAMSHMIVTTARVAEAVKKRLPEVKTVLGGFHASFLPEQTLREFPVFDFIVAGEGEMAFLQLVRTLRDGGDHRGIRGLCFRENGKITANGRGEIPPTLDELGAPGYHLFDPDVMARYCKELPIMSQRGCPFACNFCSRPYGRKVRRRTPDLVVEEVRDGIERFGVCRFNFFDETFSVNKEHVNAICSGLVESGLAKKIEWLSMVHANTLDDQLLANMKRAGCVQVFFGVESGNDDVIAAMGKGVTKERILKAAQMIRKAGLPFGAGFIFGHPHETKKSCVDTIRFAVKLNANVTAFGIMVPYPGTEIFNMVTRGEGGYKQIALSWDDYNKQVGNAIEMENLSRRQLEMFQMLGYFSVYFFNFRIREMAQVVIKHRRRLGTLIWQNLKRRLPSGSGPREALLLEPDLHSRESHRT